ncbi:MAG: isoprenyl transferase [Gammaproteobacteria bacterium]|jgi:undecaprenyl diphosphate synthase
MTFISETAGSPRAPRHVAIIMDGNGRWARNRHLPRIAGHRAGLEAVRRVVRRCGEKGVAVLTLFAFSSENWQRPPDEVRLLMGLFTTALDQEVAKLHEHNVRLRIIGDRSAFDPKLCQLIDQAEQRTARNDGLSLMIAANYGGRWDLTQAMRRLALQVKRGELEIEDIDEQSIQSALSFHGFPEPDLFIRTGGEKRISNFLLWQLAYTELYFSQLLWPDFGLEAFDEALSWYASRQRRFGRTGEQVAKAEGY